MILIVEDNETIADWIRGVVQAAGYYFDAAIDANIALYKLERLYYALALIDIGLPDMQGDELARRVRSLPEPFCHTPLVGMTGGTFVDEPGREVFIEMLRKPFLPRDLRDLIQRCARPPVPDLHVARSQ